MSFFKPQVSFPLNFASPYRNFLAVTLYAFDKKTPSMNNFSDFECSNESSPNSSWLGVTQILHHCSVSWNILFCISLAETSYTLHKNSPSKWNFWTFEQLGENSPNSSYLIWNHVSFSLNFASLFNVMRDTSSVIIQLNLYMIFTKKVHRSAKFQTFDCWGRILPNLYFDTNI